MKKIYRSAFLRRDHLCIAAALGFLALAFSASPARAGADDTKTGTDALLSQTGSAANNTADGFQALYSCASGTGNTAVGSDALLFGNLNSENTAVGWNALYSDSTGGYNTALGADALVYNTGGFFNTAVGPNALYSNRTGGINTAVGINALDFVTGNNNIGIGANAGNNITTGSSNIYIGNSVTTGNESNAIRIGDPSSPGLTTCIAGIYGGGVSVGTATAVYVDANGHLGTQASSLRFKKDIQPMGKASEVILALKPVTFHYKYDTSLTPCYGLIAEEVAKLDPHLVIRDAKGVIMTVRYDQVNAMLLNEFLKEHQKVTAQSKKLADLETAAGDQSKKIAGLEADLSKQEARLAAQEKLNEQLTASLKEQAALIQKVSMQLDMNKPAMRTAANDQ